MLKNQPTQIFDDSGWLVDWRLVDWLRKIAFWYFLSNSFFGIFQDFCSGSFLSFQIFVRAILSVHFGVLKIFFPNFADFIFEHEPNQPCSNRATKRPSKNSSMISSCAARFSPLGAPAWVHSFGGSPQLHQVVWKYVLNHTNSRGS